MNINNFTKLETADKLEKLNRLFKDEEKIETKEISDVDELFDNFKK